jgi:hypothetical protein
LAQWRESKALAVFLYLDTADGLPTFFAKVQYRATRPVTVNIVVSRKGDKVWYLATSFADAEQTEVTPTDLTLFWLPLVGIQCPFMVSGLELDWRQIAQRRRDLLGLVHVVNEMANPMVSVIKAFIVCQIDFLLFDRADDAFGVRVLCGLPHSGHTDTDTVFPETGDIALSGVALFV